MRGRNSLISEVLKVKYYKVNASKSKLGDLRTFQQRLEKKAQLVVHDTVNQLSIQKLWENGMKNSNGSHMIMPRDFLHRQQQVGWQANQQSMSCWFKESYDELNASFGQQYPGFKPQVGLKGLPPKSQLFGDPEVFNRFFAETVVGGRSIATEVQTIMTDCKEGLTRQHNANEDSNTFGLAPQDPVSTFMDMVSEPRSEDIVMEDDFNTEFRTSMNGNREITQFGIRESRDDQQARMTEDSIPDRPVPKLAVGTKVQMRLPDNDAQKKSSIASTSTARTTRGGKKPAPQKNTKPLQSFFQNKKDFDNQSQDGDQFN